MNKPAGTKVVATIEARMTSSRLPGKVLLPAHDRPMLWHLIHRLRSVELIDEVVLATTTNDTDDVLVEFAKEHDLTYFRGSEEDVMERVVRAAESVDADVVIEITADCPVIDPQLIDQGIRMFFANDCAFVSNGLVRSYPDGMDLQVFRLETLQDSMSRTDNPLHHEHPVLHIAANPDLYPQVAIVAPSVMFWPELGLTLDEPKDYVLLKRLIEHYPCGYLFSCEEAVQLLRKNPDWIVNADVHRKGAT